MNTPGYEVVWPLDRRHYLTVETHPIIMTSEPAAPATPAITAVTVVSPDADGGRRLAAKALLLGAHCSQQRISRLLRVSRWTIGRIAQRKTLTGAPEPKVREMAHTLLEESLTRGGTVEERDAARAWLQTSTSDTAERCTSATAPANVEKQNTTFASAEPSPSSSRRRPAVSASRPSATKAPVGQTIMNGAGGLSSEQMDALTTQQQRILRRSTVIDCVLRAEDLDALTMRQAVRDLLEDIATATHRIGAIVQQATR